MKKQNVLCHSSGHFSKVLNLTLLHSLTERLPPMIRLNWATHRQILQSVTLAEFSDWLYKLAEAASTVTMPQFSGAADNKTRRIRKDDGFLNAHAEAAPKAKQLEASSGCLVCQGSCAAVEKCKRFLSFGLSARWDALREHKLCRSCLDSHRGPCRSAKSCGKNGCQFKHHQLLHNDLRSTTRSSGPRNHHNLLPRGQSIQSRVIRIKEEARRFCFSTSRSYCTTMESDWAHMHFSTAVRHSL